VTTTSPDVKLANRWHCVHRGNPAAGLRHDEGMGKPPRQKCSGCGGEFVHEQGLLGVFAWRQDGRYPAGDSRGTRLTDRAAQRLADKLNAEDPDGAPAGGYVVRWIPEGMLGEPATPKPAWVRVEPGWCTCHMPPEKHDRWEIKDPNGNGKNYLISDAAIRTFGRRHIEELLSRAVPGVPLPEEAWQV
jgi:hypothetical protein